jgi:hypothetical protein
MRFLSIAATLIGLALFASPASAFSFGFFSPGNFHFVHQSNPWTNQSVINQPTPGGGNAAVVVQDGGGNASVVNQTGKGNTSVVVQSGGGLNFSSLWQFGKGNSFTLVQSTLP